VKEAWFVWRPVHVIVHAYLKYTVYQSISSKSVRYVRISRNSHQNSIW